MTEKELDALEVSWDTTVSFKGNWSKWYTPQINDRPGRVHRAERKFLRNPEHTGKGKTLRSHRKGK